MNRGKELDKLRKLKVETLDEDEFGLQDSEDSYRPDSHGSEREDDILG